MAIRIIYRGPNRFAVGACNHIYTLGLELGEGLVTHISEFSTRHLTQSLLEHPDPSSGPVGPGKDQVACLGPLGFRPTCMDSSEEWSLVNLAGVEPCIYSLKGNYPIPLDDRSMKLFDLLKLSSASKYCKLFNTCRPLTNAPFSGTIWST